MSIRFENVAVEKVPLPPKAELKAKEPKATRMTLADKLNGLDVGESIFLEGKKKVSIGQQISTGKKGGKLSGKFQVVEFGIGGDSVYADKAGVRIWRTEAGNVTQIAAE